MLTLPVGSQYEKIPILREQAHSRRVP
jgi:hypothetical protein